MADQLSPDEKLHLITRNLQVGHKQAHSQKGAEPNPCATFGASTDITEPKSSHIDSFAVIPHIYGLTLNSYCLKGQQCSETVTFAAI